MTVLSVGFAMFPFLMPSTLDPTSSLTVWDASSSRHTLGLMLIATAVLLPIVLLYTAGCIRVMRGRVSLEHIRSRATASTERNDAMWYFPGYSVSASPSRSRS